MKNLTDTNLAPENGPSIGQNGDSEAAASAIRDNNLTGRFLFSQI